MPDDTNVASPLDGLPPPVQQEISKLLAKLRRRQIQSSLDVARKTLEIMRLLVGSASQAQDVRTLIQLIKRAGAAMVAAQPHEVVIGNMVRRVLATVREEMVADNGSKARAGDDTGPVGLRTEGSFGADDNAASLHRSGPSLMKLLDAPDAPDYSRQKAKALRAPIIEGIAEVMEELSSVSTHIAEQAIEYIHANEVRPPQPPPSAIVSWLPPGQLTPHPPPRAGHSHPRTRPDRRGVPQERTQEAHVRRHRR